MAEKKFAPDEGMLFYLSGDKDAIADYALGEKNPTFYENVEIISGGVDGGKAFRCDDVHQMAYRAPGNIYAERGTLSFFWRSRYEAKETPFPIFRVAFADHSSWDSVFLRIDYNGKQGIEAFVTDINLSRIRASAVLRPFPKPNEWMHIAFSWDENVGVRLYINGILMAEKMDRRILFAGLDQFGPHSGILSSATVLGPVRYLRGGDVDEIKIYDRMLSEENIGQLYKNKPLKDVPDVERLLSEPVYRAEWERRYGWNLEANQPKYYEGNIVVRKVGITEAYDKKRWTYKSLDGIRETTWPNVYSVSRIQGRNDYFPNPCGDCYDGSGKTITYTIPDEEQWNHIEISGSAFGKITMLDGKRETPIDTRVRFQERSVHTIDRAYKGKKLEFENTLIEEPIGDFSLFYVHKGTAPRDSRRVETFYVDANQSAFKKIAKSTQNVISFVEERFLPDERNLCYGVKKAPAFNEIPEGLPMANIIIPYENLKGDGLDGVAMVIPALDTAYATDGYIKVNVQIKDPLWLYRNLLNFSFKVRVGEEKKIFFDLRDRIIPADRAMLITVAVSSEDLTSSSLQGMQIDLHYKLQKTALVEHIEDRMAEVRDNYGNLLKNRPMRPQFNRFNRFIQDLIDVLKYDPKNEIAKQYMWDCRETCGSFKGNDGSPDVLEAVKKSTLRGFPIMKPEYKAPKVLSGIEEWALYQIEMVRRIKSVMDWWLSNRLDENGEMGAGLPDGGNLLQALTALQNIGFSKEKYAIPELSHSYEDSNERLVQELLNAPWNPQYFERALEKTRALSNITARNPKGERLFMSSILSGTTVGREEPWNVSTAESYLFCGPTLLLALYSRNPRALKLILELADALCAHFYDGKNHTHICFDTGVDREEDPRAVANLLNAAYLLTKDEKYLTPLRGENWETLFADTKLPNAEAFDRLKVVNTNAEANEKMALREYINTEGFTWADCVSLDIRDAEVQRLGGLMADYGHQLPMNPVTWSFEDDNEVLNVGIVLPKSSETGFKAVLFNVSGHPVKADIVGNRVKAGVWRLKQGIDANGGQKMTDLTRNDTVYFENYEKVRVVIPPKQDVIIEMNLEKPSLPYDMRPDLAISKEDIKVSGGEVRVTVHSIGAVASPETDIVLINPEGKEVKRERIPALSAPDDLYPKTAEIVFKSAGQKTGWKVVIDPDNTLFEITRVNNTVEL